jgi:hypothetical protein
MKKNNIGITEKKQWDDKWIGIFDHYQGDLRHSYYINSVLTQNDIKVLELGAGSFRDMANLNSLGVDCWGTDYSNTSVQLAKNQFKKIKDKIFCSDAFDMLMIEDKEYDATFHNGLWVLFDDDKDILKLVKEQARISKRLIISTVHNAHNQNFVNYFEKLSKTDDLYKIRFFSVDEMKNILLTVCNKVEIIPVGKGKKYFEDRMINEGKFSRDELKSFFDETGLSNLENSERLLCIGHL